VPEEWLCQLDVSRWPKLPVLERSKDLPKAERAQEAAVEFFFASFLGNQFSMCYGEIWRTDLVQKKIDGLTFHRHVRFLEGKHSAFPNMKHPAIARDPCQVDYGELVANSHLQMTFPSVIKHG